MICTLLRVEGLKTLTTSLHLALLYKHLSLSNWSHPGATNPAFEENQTIIAKKTLLILVFNRYCIHKGTSIEVCETQYDVPIL